ncbi:MAG TPA: hypothetical protein VHM91_05425 [Verrucomicrobiales bacterium]|nr:hypothetical protein [Verrucomicrobiales bacterium]
MKRSPWSLFFLALLAGIPVSSYAQKPAPAKAAADPFAEPADPFSEDGASTVRQALVRFEVFSMPTPAARKVLRQFPKQEDLYAWLGTEWEKEKTEVKLERLSLLKIRSGQRAKLEEIDEMPFPTEFDPPQIPQSVGLGTNSLQAGPSAPEGAPPVIPVPPKKPSPPVPAAPAVPSAPANGSPPATVAPGSVPDTHLFSPWPYNTATPTSFSFRNTGWTDEIELTMEEDGKTADLNVVKEFIKFTGMSPVVPSGEISQAGFETQRCSSRLITAPGKPALAGTMSPPVNTGGPNSNTADRTWLLFITVNATRLP